MILPVLYHWSPVDRRDSIRKEGLVPFSEPTVQSGHLFFPYICLGASASCAWAYSGDMDWVSEIEIWDLWQVVLGENDEVRFRPTYGNRLEEIKVYNTIPADRVWFVATRESPAAVEKNGSQ
jgi:hypothetical protein